MKTPPSRLRQVMSLTESAFYKQDRIELTVYSFAEMARWPACRLLKTVDSRGTRDAEISNAYNRPYDNQPPAAILRPTG